MSWISDLFLGSEKVILVEKCFIYDAKGKAVEKDGADCQRGHDEGWLEYYGCSRDHENTVWHRYIQIE